MFSNTFEIPKSPSLMVLFAVRKIFWDFRSLCKIFLPCTYSSAMHIWRNQFIISVSEKNSFFALFFFTWYARSPTKSFKRSQVLTFAELHDYNEHIFIDEATSIRHNVDVIETSQQLRFKQSLFLLANSKLSKYYFLRYEVLLVYSWRRTLVLY